MIKRLFLEHPSSVGETYFKHMAVGFYFARHLFVAAIAVAVHAIFPFLFVKTASNIIEQLYGRMVQNRHNLHARAASQPKEQNAHAEN